MVDGWNPYGPTMADNAAKQQRQQMMAQRLMQPPPAQVAAPAYPAMSSVDGGAAPAPAPKVDVMQLVEALHKRQQQVTPESKAGFFGGGQDGFQAGFMGSGIGKQNSDGADVLQGLGFYNPLPAS